LTNAVPRHRRRVAGGIDDEEQIALVDDLPVLEMDFGECSADLCLHPDAVDRRELAEEAGLDTKTAFARLFEATAEEFTRDDQPLGCMISLAGTHCPPGMSNIRDMMAEHRAFSESAMAARIRGKTEQYVVRLNELTSGFNRKGRQSKPGVPTKSLWS
jgi:hypothetical protein